MSGQACVPPSSKFSPSFSVPSRRRASLPNSFPPRPLFFLYLQRPREFRALFPCFAPLEFVYYLRFPFFHKAHNPGNRIRNCQHSPRGKKLFPPNKAELFPVSSRISLQLPNLFVIEKEIFGSEKLDFMIFVVEIRYLRIFAVFFCCLGFMNATVLILSDLVTITIL